VPTSAIFGLTVALLMVGALFGVVTGGVGVVTEVNGVVGVVVRLFDGPDCPAARATAAPPAATPPMMPTSVRDAIPPLAAAGFEAAGWASTDITFDCVMVMVAVCP